MQRTFKAYTIILSALVGFAVWPSTTNAGPVFLESGGRVVVEAETFSSRTPGPLAGWVSVPDESAGGVPPFSNSRGAGYLEAFPDRSGESAGVFAPPFVDYSLWIGTPGIYQLYTRWDGRDDNSDTVFASVIELRDGPGGAADWFRYVSIPDDANFATRPWHGVGGFERTDSPFSNGEQPILWSIPDAGDYTLRYSMREDGVALDAFVLQLASLPAPVGEGPSVSSIMPAKSVPEPATLVLFGVCLVGLEFLKR